MPAPPPKRKRLGLLNITFALALGAITWWCVNAWLSIKSDYTLRFPNSGELQSNNGEYRSSFPFCSRAADVDEKYLIIQRPNFPEPWSISTELRDLRTGKLIVSEQETLAARLDSPVDYTLPNELANSNGCMMLIAYGRSPDSSKRGSVCEWNLLTNKRRILKPPAGGTSYLLSRDASKLVATTSLSPFMPSLMGPPHWANLLPVALLADSGNDVHRLGPMLVRVYSLPAVVLKSSFALPSPCGLSLKEITPDGSGLVIGQAAMPNHFFDTLNDSSIQVFHPRGLAVYDLADGRLLQCIADHPGVISEINLWVGLGRNLVEVILENDPYQKNSAPKKQELNNNGERIEELISRIREYEVAYYHLPTNRWINLDGDRAASIVSSNRVDRILSHYKSTDNWRVWEIDRNGNSVQLSWLTSQISHNVKLLDAFSQLAFIRTQYRQLPKWSQEIRGKLGSLLDRFARPSFSLVFYDYLQDRELGVYRVGSNEPGKLNKSAKGSYLILNTTNETEHEVAVFSLPVKAWSPWWARCAGLLVGAFVFYWWLERISNLSSAIQVNMAN